MTPLTILSTEIRQLDGLYSLNDLHKAAIAAGQVRRARTKEPGKFLASPHIVELISEISVTQNLGNEPVRTIQGGKAQDQGTYVCKELVYAYAMWISAKFHLAVIRAFDALHRTNQPDPCQAIPPFVAVGGGMAHQRVLLSFDGDGHSYMAKPVPFNACVITPEQFLQRMTENTTWLFPVETGVLFAAVEKLQAQLRRRYVRDMDDGAWT